MVRDYNNRHALEQKLRSAPTPPAADHLMVGHWRTIATVLARTGQELRQMPIPDHERGGWRVEQDFVAAIRGERPVTRTDFLTGARYMQFTEAVARSSRAQAPVSLPLKEFSSPDE